MINMSVIFFPANIKPPKRLHLQYLQQGMIKYKILSLHKKNCTSNIFEYFLYFETICENVTNVSKVHQHLLSVVHSC